MTLQEYDWNKADSVRWLYLGNDKRWEKMRRISDALDKALNTVNLGD